MKNTAISIPLGMLTKKHYCHKCGTKLEKYPKTRIVKRGDPDYHEYRIKRMRPLGDIEVTEYDFLHCSVCENTISYREQCVIREMQKLAAKNILSDEDMQKYRQKRKTLFSEKKNSARSFLG